MFKACDGRRGLAARRSMMRWEGVIVERKKKQMDVGAQLHDDFLDVLLNDGLSDLQIKTWLLTAMDSMLWLACPLFVSLILCLFSTLRQGKDNLPPGPRGWPIVGNLFQLGSKPHATLATLARTYGPLFSLRLGTKRVIVASSPSAAALVLKTHDGTTSSRPIPQVTQFDLYSPYSFIWSDCTESWKQLKAICRTHLFSGKMINDGEGLRRQKVEEMVRRLRSSEGKEVHIPELLFATIFGMLAANIFSDDAERATGKTGKIKRLSRRMVELSTAPNISDYFPAIADLDLQGLRREAMACGKEMYDIWEGVIVERKKQRMEGRVKLHDDFLDVLLSTGLPDIQIKSWLLDMFVAGTDSTTTTVEWAMAEFIRHPEIMAKLRNELSDALSSSGTDVLSMEQKLKQLPYFQACIKETLRLHPPAPLLPHRAADKCEGLGHTIPKGYLVWVNVWAIGRDPESWADPLTFLPQRFIDSPNLDFKGGDYQFIPFGSGRRMCPGFPLGTRFVESILAALVHNFEWSLPQGMEISQLSMEEKFGLTIPRKQPLQIIAKFIGQ
ncbi:CYP80B2 [Nymphaea thermarum]|nr:CYP80B2 [Nymphaea thermarum]